MGFHSRGCCYGDLEARLEEIKQKVENSEEEAQERAGIEKKLRRMVESLVDGECPVCGINQLTRQRSRERRSASFVR